MKSDTEPFLGNTTKFRYIKPLFMHCEEASRAGVIITDRNLYYPMEILQKYKNIFSPDWIFDNSSLEKTGILYRIKLTVPDV